MSLMRRDPFRDLASMRDTFNRFFDQALTWPRTEFAAIFDDVPMLDIYETDEQVKVDVSLPGMKAEDIHVTLSGNVLRIEGEYKAKDEVNEDQFFRREMRYGSFERQVILPESADVSQPTSEFENGMLTIAFPKVAKAEPKAIAVTVKDKEKEVAVPA